LAESGGEDPTAVGYQGMYDKAVRILGGFDRAPAEAICGIVAFHYNQFDRAMTRTHSRRVAEVAMRMKAMLDVAPWSERDLTAEAHSSLDSALSDSVIERVLFWSALPIDGGSAEFVEMLTEIKSHRPSDAFKLHLLAAENFLTAGVPAVANEHAEQLRHGRSTEAWYADFRARLEGVGVK
jgi:hypothetical protein